MADETWRSRNFALFIRYLILAPSPARSLPPLLDPFLRSPACLRSKSSARSSSRLGLLALLAREPGPAPAQIQNRSVPW